MLDGKDVFRHTHSPRFLSKSIVARYSSVSYLNTGSGLSGGHVPARMDFISDCCPGEVSPAMLALINLMTRPKNRYPSHDAVVATNLYCKPQHHPKKLVSHPLLETAFGHSPGSVCCVLATRSECASLP